MSSTASIAFWGHEATQLPQLIHLCFKKITSFVDFHVWGLLHQAHLRGHPLKKTTVLIPGPSWIMYRSMHAIDPVKPEETDCSSSLTAAAEVKSSVLFMTKRQYLHLETVTIDYGPLKNVVLKRCFKRASPEADIRRAVLVWVFSPGNHKKYQQRSDR